MLAKLAPWPPLAWIGADDAGLWIGIPAAGLLALNWSGAATGLPRLALISSLALHLVVLAGLPDPARQDRPPAPASVQATLRLAPPLPPSGPAVPAGIPEARRLPPRPIAPSAKAGTGAAAPPAAPLAANTAPAPDAGGGVPNAARREETAAAPAPPSPPATESPRPAEDSQALDDYGHRLVELLARHRQYPRLAALRGWEGEVRLRLKVAGKGGLLAVQVVRSSGHELLDQDALQLVQGTALPALPEHFGGREIQVVVPIHYKLQKST